MLPNPPERNSLRVCPGECHRCYRWQGKSQGKEQVVHCTLSFVLCSTYPAFACEPPHGWTSPSFAIVHHIYIYIYILRRLTLGPTLGPTLWPNDKCDWKRVSSRNSTNVGWRRSPPTTSPSSSNRQTEWGVLYRWRVVMLLGTVVHWIGRE